MPLFTVEENCVTKTSSSKQHFNICTGIRDSMTKSLSQIQIKISIFREHATSALAGFYAGSLLETENVGFCGGMKTREPGENTRSKVRTNNKLNSHMTPGLNRTRVLITAPSLLTNDSWSGDMCH